MSLSDPQLQTVLLDCLKRRAPAQETFNGGDLAPADWRRLRDMARVQRISPLLHSRLRRMPSAASGLPLPVQKELAQAFQACTMRNLLLFAELRQMADAFQAQGIPLIALKGLHLAAAVYAEAGMREMDDIDILVPKAHLARAAAALQELGYASKEPLDIPRWTENVHHLPRMMNARRTVVEVHWNVTWPKDRHALSSLDGLWERAQPLAVAGAQIRGLSAEDLLLHLCIHASFQHMFYTGLRPACDILAVTQACRDDLDWDRTLQLARQSEWQAGVYLILRLARECLNADVPPAVLAELKPARDDEAFRAAYALLWTIDSDVSALPRNLARMWHRASPWRKALDIGRALAPNRAKIAKEYGLAAGSWRLGFYYPRYVADLGRKHFQALRQLQQSDPETRQMALTKSVLMDWLYQE